MLPRSPIFEQQPMAEMLDSLDMLLSRATRVEQSKEQISLSTLKQSEIDKIMKAVSTCKDVADDYYLNTIEPKISEREAIYDAKHEHYSKKFPELSEMTKWCSKDVQTSLNWIMPSLVEAFVGGDDVVDIKGVGKEDDVRADKVKQLLKYQLERKNNCFTFMTAILSIALKTNFAVAKVYWNRTEDRQEHEMLLNTLDRDTITALNIEEEKGNISIKSIKPIKDAPDLQKIVFDKITVKDNHPIMEYLPASEFRFTPEASSLQDCKFVAHKKVVYGDYLKRKEREGIYENIDVAMTKAGNFREDYRDYNYNKARERIQDSDNASKAFELYECYLQVDYNNDGIYENIVVHCIGDTPIRIVNNEFEMYPFFVASSVVDPHVIFNDESFADILEQLQDLKTALVKQIIINVAKNNSPQTFYDSRSIEDLDALYSGDEYVPVYGEPTRALYSPPSPQVSGMAFNLVEYAQNEIESQSGSTRYNQGLDSNSLNKMLALDTPIPLADGTFKLNKDIVEGDMLIGSDGKPTRVLEAHPEQRPDKCFAIYFANGEVIKAGGEHKWSVYRGNKNKNGEHMFERLTTQYLYSQYKNKVKLCIPKVTNADFGEKDLPFDPYLLGLWLGHGNPATGIFKSYDNEVKEAFEKWASQYDGAYLKDVTPAVIKKFTFYEICNAPIKEVLHDIQQMEFYGESKRGIPKLYLQGSYDQRFALLSGLLDSVGITVGSEIRLTTANATLLADMKRLLQTFGVKYREKSFENGNYTSLSPTYTILFFKMEHCPSRLPRRIKAWSKPFSQIRTKTIEIVRMKEIKVEPMRCLTVAAVDELYCCGEHQTLTSNTATGITAILGQADKRIRLIGKLIAENFSVPLFKFIILLNQKYLEREQLVRLGNDEVTISQSDLDVDYDFLVNVGQGAGTKEMQIQYLMILVNQIYPILQNNGVVTEHSWFNIVKELLNKMGLRNTENYLIDPSSEEFAQRKQEAMVQQQQSQQMAMQAQQMKYQTEIEKARTPKIMGQIRDLPLDVQVKYLLDYLGIQTSIESVTEKELINNA